jgi:drug/metabolite transporter (DMT)-like permease
VFVVISLAKWHWQSPATAVGWIALIALSVSTLIAVLLLFVSINRIGPFRSAVIMNLEPLLATVISVPVLGEILSPLQMVGGIVMLAALVVFQLKR